ncbi:MAG TPA: hypothetical protein VH054_23220 [Polyangiaceae bacterium]|nr:hypothetical protein [Polyangiaceae bacterium]
MRLTYERDTGAERCPEEATLREAVERRLGYDPFFPWADQTIVARIHGDSSALRGTVELVDKAGMVRGVRELSAPIEQCGELVSGMALAISIAINPASVDRAAGSDPHASDAPDDAAVEWSAARATEDATAAPPAPARDAGAGAAPTSHAPAETARWRLEVGAGVEASAFVLPAAGFGPSLEARLRRDPWSVGLEGRYLFGLDTSRGGETIASSLIEGALLGCASFGVPFACVDLSMGRLAIEGRGRQPHGDDGLVGRAGLRAGAELALSNDFRVVAYGDLMVNLGRQTVDVDSQHVWESSIVGGFAGLSLHGRFR